MYTHGGMSHFLPTCRLLSLVDHGGDTRIEQRDAWAIFVLFLLRTAERRLIIPYSQSLLAK